MDTMTDELRPSNERGFGARVEPHGREPHLPDPADEPPALDLLRGPDGLVSEIVTVDRAAVGHVDLPATLGATVGAR
jgi:hypothetical protein